MSFSESANVQNQFVHFLLLSRLFQEYNNHTSIKTFVAFITGV